MGRYGPLVTVTRFDTAPPELEWQLPLNGELYRLIPGADRPDYSLLVLDRPLHFYPRDGFDLSRVEADQHVQDRKGRTMVRVHALLLCARFVGQQLHPGMTDLSVNLAYVIDNSLARDAEVDFGKIEFAGIGFPARDTLRCRAPRARRPRWPPASLPTPVSPLPRPNSLNRPPRPNRPQCQSPQRRPKRPPRPHGTARTTGPRHGIRPRTSSTSSPAPCAGGSRSSGVRPSTG
jgi:hypothetical protein